MVKDNAAKCLSLNIFIVVFLNVARKWAMKGRKCRKMSES